MASIIKLKILGGFLGAGKTTTLLRLAEHYVNAGQTVGIITNDQAKGLVDTERFRALGFTTGEVAGGCFCCRFEDFIARADELIAKSRPDVILAEPVGSCTDLVATVFRPIEKFHTDRFALAPFTVLIDPIRTLNLLGGEGKARLSEKITYIFRLQQQEAEAITLNKIDLLSGEQLADIQRLLHQRFPTAKIFALSALTGEGLVELVSYLETPHRDDRVLANIDYDIYAEGEAQLGWLNSALQLRADTALDVDTALRELAGAVRQQFQTDAVEIANGKFLLRGDRQTAVVNVVSNATQPMLSQSAAERAATLDLVINLRAQAEPSVIQQIVQHGLDAWLECNGLTVLGSTSQAFKPPRPEAHPSNRQGGLRTKSTTMR
jgi:G3E family GTPase